MASIEPVKPFARWVWRKLKKILPNEEWQQWFEDQGQKTADIFDQYLDDEVWNGLLSTGSTVVFVVKEICGLFPEGECQRIFVEHLKSVLEEAVVAAVKAAWGSASSWGQVRRVD